MVTAFATLAVALAMVGVFGILGYSVAAARSRLWVRRALGASTGDVLRLVVSSALRVVTAGAAIGCIPGCGVRSIHRISVVRRAAAGLRHLRRGDDAGGDDRSAVDRRSGVASDEIDPAVALRNK